MFELKFGADISVAEAVRKASMRILDERRSDGRTTHPFYWGAFITAGDWKSPR